MDKFSQNDQNVVTMTDFAPQSGFAVLSQVEAYWDALRGDSLLPKRSQIDPRGIEAALEYAFIIERIAPGVARLRIAGSHLSDLMGMEVRGMPITAFLGIPSRRRFSDMMEEVFETPATATLDLSHVGEFGTSMSARMLLLPLKSDMGDVSRILGCLVTSGKIEDTPCRFDIDTIKLTAIKSGEPILPQPVREHGAIFETPPSETPPSETFPSDAPPAATRQQGFSAPKTDFTGAPKKGHPPYLRLVKSDD